MDSVPTPLTDQDQDSRVIAALHTDPCVLSSISEHLTGMGVFSPHRSVPSHDPKLDPRRSRPSLGGQPSPQPEPPAARYDHDRAEALCMLARQAYKRPADGEGYRTRNIRGLPTVTFLDRNLLTESFTGVLHVTVHGAFNLRPADLDGRVRPFAEVFVAASSFRTKTAGKTLDPVWDEDHWLYVKNPDYDSLCVRVVDESCFSEGDDLGVAVLGLRGIANSPGETFKFRLPLRGFAGENSTVTLSCRFLKFTELEGPETIPALTALQGGEAVPSAEPAKREELGADGLEPVAYIDCGLTETQAWLFRNSEKRQLAIAFRGTEQTQLKDLVADARLMPCGFTTIAQCTRDNINVHRGFMRAYKSVRRLISGLIQIITDSRPGSEDTERGADSNWEVLFTGHSLGGALATLGAYELGLYKSYAGWIKSISLYTYGSPRVGNVAFARDFDRLVPNAWRFTNRLDLVPSVPLARFLFGYCHVGHPVRLRGDGVLLKGLNNVEAQTRTTSKEPRTDVQADVFWLRALLSLRGLAEHSADLYQDRLKEARGRHARRK
ncbi:hypothetical protein PLESTF_000759300 [Pleodorina starrii]|nr:hypothetical protein PLESTF_000759300 [Pleodorina starrii]